MGIGCPSGPTATVDRESCARTAPPFSRATAILPSAHLPGDCLVTPGTDGLLMHSVALKKGAYFPGPQILALLATASENTHKLVHVAHFDPGYGDKRVPCTSETSVTVSASTRCNPPKN
jgi:hypothetical protein